MVQMTDICSDRNGWPMESGMCPISDLVSEFARLMVKKNSLDAERKQAIESAQRIHQVEIGQLDKELEELRVEIELLAVEARANWTGKSYTFSNGKIGFRAGRESIEVDNPDRNQICLEEVTSAVLSTLDETKSRGVAVLNFIKVEVKLDRTAALNAVQKQLVSEAELQKLGLGIREAQDKFFIDVS